MIKLLRRFVSSAHFEKGHACAGASATFENRLQQLSGQAVPAKFGSDGDVVRAGVGGRSQLVMATPDTWLDLGPSRAATSGLVSGTATRGPTAEQRTAARPRSSQVSQRLVDVANPNPRTA